MRTRDINIVRESKGKKERRAGGVNVYTLARTHIFEANSSQDLEDMLSVAISDKENTERNIVELQKHLQSVMDEIAQIQNLIVLAKEDEK